MANQICEHFVQDIVNQVPVKDQIQAYLDAHPDYKVVACSYATTGISREAMIICYEAGGPKVDMGIKAKK